MIKYFNIKGGDAMRYSVNWVMWRAFIKPTTCLECATRNGRIFSYDDIISIGEPRLHPNCGCWLEKIEAIKAGIATSKGCYFQMTDLCL